MAAETPKYHGKIVALEGPLDAVSTQLRLLPTVPHIMILPNIQSYLTTDKTDRPFNARQLIAKVQKAVKARHQAALAFLEQATADKKRMVFMCGGTIGAQAFCLSAICQNETKGDLGKADTIFRSIAKGGVEGLSSRPSSKVWTRQALARRGNNNKCPNGSDEEGVSDLDYIMLAMRAADALDRETEALQPPGQDVDLTFRRGTRMYSLPLVDFSDHGKILDAIHALGTSMGDKTKSIYLRLDDRAKAIGMSKGERVGISSIVCRRPMRITVSVRPPSPSSAEEFNDEDNDEDAATAMPRPFSGSHSAPQSPDGVVYGEATVVQVRSSPDRKTRRRAHSLDSVWSGSERENLVPEATLWDVGSGNDAKWHAKWDAKWDAHRHRKRPSSCVNMSHTTDDLKPASGYPEVPKAVFVKAHQTTIPRSNTIPRRGTRGARGRKNADAKKLRKGDGLEETVLKVVAMQPPSWEPVLDLVEDHTIYFPEATRDHSFNLVLTGFKGGHYPIPETVVKKAPTAAGARQEERAGPVRCPYTGKMFSSNAAAATADDYDPFASHGDYGASVAQWIQRGSIERLKAIPQPFNSAIPSPPASVESDGRFQVLSTAGQTTAVGIHKALRSVLSGYAPPEDASYHQAQLARFPGMDCLWTPFFQDLGTGSKGLKGDRIDLILAISAQRAVQKTFVSTIVGQLEKLGTKPSGLSRSGRLHLRFLLFGVMQAFARQPVPAGTQDDPMQNHSLMATLLVPHLDAYFNTNIDVRFLILEYPEDHLATMLALQALVGSESFKVAGILDGDDPGTRDPSPRPSSPLLRPDSRHFDRAASTPTVAPASTPADVTVMSLPSPSPSLETCSFSKANYVLTSSASDSEIANLISTVWKELISTSDFYVPEHTPRKVMANNASNRQGPSQANLAGTKPASAIGRKPSAEALRLKASSEALRRKPSVLDLVAEGEVVVNANVRADANPNGHSAVPMLVPMPPRPPSPTPSQAPSLAPSRAPSARSGRSAWSGRSKRTQRLIRHLRQRAAVEKDHVSDSDEAADDMFYIDERRLMPEYHRHVGQKANTRKALKWLGLA